MISRQHRFHGYRSLTATYRKGKTVRSGALSLKYALNPRRDQYRAAVVVSRKVSKSAVVRNRIRRRLYERVRLSVPATAPYDMVFTVYGEQLADIPAAELDTTVAKLLVQAGISDDSTPVVNGAHGIVKP